LEAELERRPAAWGSCTWNGSRRDVLALGARLSFREKILWLEEGARLALAFEAARRKLKKNSSERESLID
jgi:hypothetical protein